MRKRVPVTPLRHALRDDSALRPLVIDGLGAVARAHRGYFDRAIRSAFADSLDLDKAMESGHEQENRWDYLLGHRPSGEVVALEPHSAKQDEVSAVINKRSDARSQLNGHLRDGARVAAWLWVASGKVHFADTEKARRRLDQNGIKFVGTKVTIKHLPPARVTDRGSAEKPGRKGRP
jgi:hypothetical protein